MEPIRVDAHVFISQAQLVNRLRHLIGQRHHTIADGPDGRTRVTFTPMTAIGRIH